MNIIKPVKTLVSISALCAAIAFSSVPDVYAAGNHFGAGGPGDYQQGGYKGKHMMKRMIKELSLTETQQVQIKALKAQAKEQYAAFRESMKKFKSAEKVLIQAELFDEQAYTALHAAYQNTFAQMALTRAQTKHAIFNVLTTQQQEQWQAKMKQRKEKGKRGNRG